MALPALGSFLWDPTSTAALNDPELTNYDFLEALRHLAYTRQDKMLRPVDYHNLGAEELGGVYESLLALTPQVNGGGGHFSFAEFTGNRRKTSGSYYTPDALVHCLLDSALDPVVEAAVTNKTAVDAEQAILDLKVCDPAVGSGHFLVGAAHRLARHLARVRAYADGESEPSPLLYQRALRDVIGRCLYGVDVNPMAAELCRVGLWLEALEPGKPLSFLDRHIRVGNSLLGATPELIEAGLPDSAFKPIQGDDKKTCSELRKWNKTEREYGQRDLGFVAESEEEYDSLASRSRSIDHAPDGTLGDIRRKDAQFRRMQESEDYRHAQQVADAWCAAFVWPKRPGAADALTTDTLRRLREDPSALAAAQQEETERIADAYQFFHWHVAFPEVFANGGFDCVLGNPPWEHTELKEKEWFAGRHAGIVNARTGAERKRLIAALQDEDPPLYASYADALRRHDGLSHLLRNTGRFPRAARGRINLYAVFAEGMRNLVNDRGRAGCVLPTGIATDDSTKIFFQNVVETRSLVSLFDFENKGIFFPRVHSSYKFCLFTTGSGNVPTSDRAEFVFFAHAVEELYDPERRFTLSPDDITLLNPNTRTCPIFRSRMDAELTKAIYRRVPVFSREASDGEPEDNPWGIRFKQGLFNMTSDSDLFRKRSDLEADGWRLKGNVFHKNGKECLPLYEAKMVHHFDHRWASFRGLDSGSVSLADKQNADLSCLPQYWVDAREVRLRSASILRQTARCRWLIGIRNVTNTTNERTVVGGVFPLAAVGNSLPIWTAVAAPATALPALLSSFVCDYQARLKMGGINFNFFIAKQIPVLSPDAFREPPRWDRVAASTYDWLLPRVLELTYTSRELESFASDCGWADPPFRWDEERRFRLRCELDAAFFHLYLRADKRGHWQPARQVGGNHVETPEQHADLTHYFPTPRDAVDYILGTFPIVRRKDDARYGEYRTKRVILDIYDAMQTAATTDEPYRTVLDPPPADRSCCHPPRVRTLDLASLSDGAWARPRVDDTAAETVVLAAVLKAIGGPASMRTVRLTALLAMEPRLLTLSLSPDDAGHWERLVGPEAPAQDSTAEPLANYAWGTAVRQLRGTGRLIENLSDGTWAAGLGLDAIHTEGWPDGRAGMVMQALRRRDPEEIVRTLPENVRHWIDVEAA